MSGGADVLHFGSSSSSSWAVSAIERRGCSGAVLSICVRGGHLVLRRPLAGRGASEIAMKNSTTLRRRRLPAPLVDAFWTGGGDAAAAAAATAVSHRTVSAAPKIITAGPVLDEF